MLHPVLYQHVVSDMYAMYAMKCYHALSHAILSYHPMVPSSHPLVRLSACQPVSLSSYPILSYPILSYPILSYPIPSCNKTQLRRATPFHTMPRLTTQVWMDQFPDSPHIFTVRAVEFTQLSFSVRVQRCREKGSFIVCCCLYMSSVNLSIWLLFMAIHSIIRTDVLHALFKAWIFKPVPKLCFCETPSLTCT